MTRPTDILQDPVLAGHAQAIRALVRASIEDIIEIGRRLTEAKELVGHGGWLRWLKREFDWSQDTARNFMNVFELSTKNRTVRNLTIPARALYALARKSTPEDVREEIVTRAAAGERIPVAKITKARPAESITLVGSRAEARPLKSVALERQPQPTYTAETISGMETISALRKVTPLADGDHIVWARETVRRDVKAALAAIRDPEEKKRLFQELRELLDRMECASRDSAKAS